MTKRIFIGTVALLCFAVVLVVLPEPARAANSTCDGRLATIVAEPGKPTKGTSGNDVIVGTKGRDVIKGLDGDDIICGMGGNDKILGGRGNDVLIGGGGNDRLVGNAGVDQLSGVKGQDTCTNDGADLLKSCEKRTKTKSSFVDRVCGKVARAKIPAEALDSLADDRWRFSAYVNVDVFGTTYPLVLQTLFDGFHIEGWLFDKQNNFVRWELLGDDLYFNDLIDRRQIDVDVYRTGERTCRAG